MKVFPCKAADNLPSTQDSNFLRNRGGRASIAIVSVQSSHPFRSVAELGPCVCNLIPSLVFMGCGQREMIAAV